MSVTFPTALETTCFGNSFVRCPFLDPIAKVAGAPVAGDPKFQRRRQVLILTGFSPVSFNFP